MRMTWFEIVEDILNDLDSDVVTSWDDTEESRQVSQIMETTYWNLIDGHDWPHLYKPFQLTESSSSTPTHMTIANNVMNIDFVKYNIRSSTDTKDRFTTIPFVRPQEFMHRLDARDSSATNVDQITDASGIFLNIYNDRAPSFYTSFDEETIVFDAYDSDVETFLRTTKTQCYGKIYPTLTVTDGFYVDLPTEAFSWFLNEAKSTAAIVLKQQQHPKAEQHSITQRRRMAQQAWKINDNMGIRYPNFGRRSRK